MDGHGRTNNPNGFKPIAWVFLGLWAVIYVALAIGRGIPYPAYELLSFVIFMSGASLVLRLQTRRRQSRRRTTT